MSRVIGTIAFVFILIPTVIAALERLDIEGISTPAIAMLNDILTMIPNIAVAILLVLIGMWLGKWLKRFTTDLLRRIGFDSYFKGMGVGATAKRPNSLSFSEIVGYIGQIIHGEPAKDVQAHQFSRRDGDARLILIAHASSFPTATVHGTRSPLKSTIAEFKRHSSKLGALA